MEGEHGEEERSSLSRAALWTGRSLYWGGEGGVASSWDLGLKTLRFLPAQKASRSGPPGAGES